ncbi:hypothetical protein GGX14DRAFT_593800 [Mycena pura]|uniref:Uncharacterized protein n=1 Tax=Mycena pura TaxID=153505 RepID=A0AAD6UQZ9_9AGAR|nr:hypothetical protein GGX14DRAFT_593800 [Mycena pura]
MDRAQRSPDSRGAWRAALAWHPRVSWARAQRTSIVWPSNNARQGATGPRAPHLGRAGRLRCRRHMAAQAAAWAPVDRNPSPWSANRAARTSSAAGGACVIGACGASGTVERVEASRQAAAARSRSAAPRHARANAPVRCGDTVLRFAGGAAFMFRAARTLGAATATPGCLPAYTFHAIGGVRGAFAAAPARTDGNSMRTPGSCSTEPAARRDVCCPHPRTARRPGPSAQSSRPDCRWGVYQAPRHVHEPALWDPALRFGTEKRRRGRASGCAADVMHCGWEWKRAAPGAPRS